MHALSLALPITCAAAVAVDESPFSGDVAARARAPSLARPAPTVTDAYERVRQASERRWVWFDGPAPTAQLEPMLNLLEHAQDDGLVPDDYHARELRAGLEAMRTTGIAPNDFHLNEFDRGISAAALAYLRHLHLGRIDPASAHPDVKLEARRFDAASILGAAVREGTVARLRELVAPSNPMYRRLRDALSRYRGLAARDEPSALPTPPGGKLVPGQSWLEMPRVAELLTRLGDLSPGEPVGHTLDGALLASVRRFQQRHGLFADGVLGPRTLAQLRVPLADRVAQIELSLERLRWLPMIDAPAMVAINIPSFELWASRRADDASVQSLHSRIVVGSARDNRTPIFVGSMRWIEFNPYWNVPPSISRKELVPKLRNDPAYLARNNMEILGRDGSRASVADPAVLDGILAGTYRIRQNPGAMNSLGRIKFVLPNSMAIYLHDTPGRELFARARRDFSHGCIRVEDPRALAALLLADTGSWPSERIDAAIDSQQRTIAGLKRPVPVLIFYLSAIVHEDGIVSFLPDIYGYDALVRAALVAARTHRVQAKPGRR